MAETPKEPQKLTELLKKPDVRQPALLFLVLLIPLLVAGIASLRSPLSPPAPVLLQQPVQQAQPVIKIPAGINLQSRGKMSGEGRKPACGFQDLVGQRPDDAMDARLRESGMTYQILQPGDVTVPKGSGQRRVNLWLDDRGVIRQVTCD